MPAISAERQSISAVASAIINGDIQGSVTYHLFNIISDLHDHVSTCERCDSFCSTDDTSCVDGETWCDSCADDHSFCCDHCGELYPNDQATNVDDESWCDSCINNNAYYWESDGEYHAEPEETEDDHGIPDYHSTDLDIGQQLESNVLGVELETYQTKIDDAAGFFSGVRDNWSDGFKFERDGSLDDEYGVELVSSPFTLSEIKGEESSPWFKVVKWCKENRAKSWDAGQGYGMHISLNGAALQPCHRARIVRFFNDNQSLCESLAGRKETHWAKYSPKNKLSDECKQTDKYQAATNRGDRIEVRIFRGSLNWDRFIRNCEFVDAVRVYTETSGCSGRALSEHSFRFWLALPENRTAYPLLASFLGVSKKKETTTSVEV